MPKYNTQCRGKCMTKKQVEAQFRRWFKADLARSTATTRRTLWNDHVDGLQKEGSISEHQAYTWTQPAWVDRHGKGYLRKLRRQRRAGW